MTPPCPLLALSTELILQIIHFMAPESHLDFSLSCQQVYACSSDILRRHQNAHAKYRVTSDLDPTTIPNLLRSAARGGPDDWIELWHVRAIEIWRDRLGWDEWRTYDFETPVQDSRNEVVEWEWRDGEIDDYLGGLGDKLDEEWYERADKEIREGKDGMLKYLVVALCPRLRDLRFVAQGHDEGSCLHWLKIVVDRYVKDEPQAPTGFSKWEFSEDEDLREDGDFGEDEDEDEEDESEEDEEDEDEELEVDSLELDELKLDDDDEDYSNNQLHQADDDDNQTSSLTRENALQAHMFILSKYWPPGLFSLPNLAVGVPSSTWFDTRSNTPSTQMLCTLLRLPKITSLYYANLRHLDNDQTQYMLTLPPNCSSLKHLFLDNCEGDHMPHLFSEALTAAPKSIITAAFRSGDAHLEHSDDLVAGFGRHQSGSMESLMFYDYGRDTHGSIHGYRCSAYKPDEFDKFDVIKQLSISMSDIELGCYYQDADMSDHEEFFVRYVSTCFPESLECLVVWGAPGSGHSGDKKGGTEIFERAVVRMIKDKNRDYSYEDEEDEEDEGEEEKEKEKEGGKEKTEEEKERQRQKQFEEGEGEEYRAYIDGGLDPDKYYRDLKAVYLEEVESRKPRRWSRANLEPRTKLDFQEGIAIGMKEGVDVHTLTNRREMLHEMSFPEAPDMYSLESGPHWGTRQGDWVFNPYIGRRVPKGCGKCGRCETCLAEYPKELWDSLEAMPVDDGTVEE
jgi:hypothetical protein